MVAPNFKELVLAIYMYVHLFVDVLGCSPQSHTGGTPPVHHR